MEEQKLDVAVSATFQVSKQFLSDILTSVAESNGMVMSWLGDDKTTITRIAEGETWLAPLSVIRIKATYDRKEDEEGDRKGETVLDLPRIQTGLARALTYPNLGSSYRADILKALVENDAGEIDEVSADVIVQLAIFNEVVYG